MGMLSKQLDCFTRSLMVSLIRPIPVVLDGHEHPVRHFGGLAIDQRFRKLIEIQTGVLARRVRLETRELNLSVHVDSTSNPFVPAIISPGTRM